jgi:hypothetical protein
MAIKSRKAKTKPGRIAGIVGFMLYFFTIFR